MTVSYGLHQTSIASFGFKLQTAKVKIVENKKKKKRISEMC